MDAKHIITLILLITFIPACLSDPRDICPPKDLLPEECMCQKDFQSPRAMVRCEVTDKEVILDCFNKTSDYGYEYFFLDYSSVTYMPAEAFKIKRLASLFLFDTTMVSLFDEPPETTDLEALVCHKLKLTRAIQWELLAKTPNIKNLTIEHSPLKSIDQKFVENAPRALERINIVNCSINSIHDGAFAEMSNLRDVVINYGKIKYLNRTMFPPDCKLKTFSFQYHKIEVIPNDMFTNMKYLSHIWLNGNLLSQVDEATYRDSFENLLSFWIDGNPINCNCSFKWFTEIERSRSFWQNMKGQCEEPKHMQGTALNELTANDFEHCDNRLENWIS